MFGSSQSREANKLYTLGIFLNTIGVDFLELISHFIRIRVSYFLIKFWLPPARHPEYLAGCESCDLIIAAMVTFPGGPEMNQHPNVGRVQSIDGSPLSF